MNSIRAVLSAILLSSIFFFSSWNICLGFSDVKPSTVVVLGLYHLRFEMKGYESMDARHLSEVLEKLRPDIIATELNQEWLDAYNNGKAPPEMAETIKTNECGLVILPLAKKHDWEVIGVGVESYEEAKRQKEQKELLTKTDYGKGQLDGFEKFISIFYDVVNRHFSTFEAFNSPEYDKLMEIKHRFHSSITYHYWETRNAKLTENICKITKKYPGKRIVVTIGAEHGYALRQGLTTCPGTIQLSFTQTLLK